MRFLETYWPVIIMVLTLGLIAKFLPNVPSSFNVSSIQTYYSTLVGIITFIIGFTFVAFEILVSSTSKAATGFVNSGYFASFRKIIIWTVCLGFLAIALCLVGILEDSISNKKAYFFITSLISGTSLLSGLNAHLIALRFVSK